MKIGNLYKSQEIMEFKGCYAMEKIHGTSAHVNWKDGELIFFSGGYKQDAFVSMFNPEWLKTLFGIRYPKTQVIIYGEAYGGKIQAMSKTYGDIVRFVAFEVKMGDRWLAVPEAEEVAKSLSFDFVPYKLIHTTMDEINAERDADSVQAVKNGVGEGKMREGVVLRPIYEAVDKWGARIIAKHKREEFGETKTPRPLDVDKIKVLTDAKEIAQEWVTPMRLQHVLDSFPEFSMEQMGQIIGSMIEDIRREAGAQEFLDKFAKTAIGKHTVSLFKDLLRQDLKLKEVL
jgi:hypothetical protein